ncbi:MAG: class II aldolase/adducin family protein [bacterium]|nr:class II aldolase/adducin family protein [bacterium]MDE0288548.1 class II aldolase/adducin family protein [bacterium]MDE0438809.1 class II aldolase/adducin family protein [bacterium]
MISTPRSRRGDVAATARMVASAGLVEAFGHVSARSERGFLITSTRPMSDCTAEDVIAVDAGVPVQGPVDRLPLEAPMHDAIYRARPGVAAICRGHPPFAVIWGTTTERLPLLHGLGGMAGAVVRVHPEIELVKSVEHADRVAATLGDDFSMLLAANGALSVGSDLLEAATRLWFLEERARVVVQARSARIRMETRHEKMWRVRMEDSGAELVRAKQWMLRTFGESPGAGEGHRS